VNEALQHMEHHNFVNLCVEGVLDAMDAPGSYDIERRWKQSSLPSPAWESCFPPLQMRVPVIAPSATTQF
jgi:hypothetical protein